MPSPLMSSMADDRVIDLREQRQPFLFDTMAHVINKRYRYRTTTLGIYFVYTRTSCELHQCELVPTVGTGCTEGIHHAHRQHKIPYCSYIK